ncbi:EF-hand domain-containing protein 1-like [Octopus sinensis]|uniref:EF-hand domain-containing protein 1-like n=1 Tax=Octopus sinensis TaxID=2607531 RepID=A0A6P7SRT9_9MOLL|nr:EF-hand domain-containing protein 1-like [Octopus sinensis]
MEGLPFIPGNSFRDPTKTSFHRSQTLDYQNGYRIKKLIQRGIGGEILDKNQLNEQELQDLANFHTLQTYGEPKPAAPDPFIPAHVSLNNKVLRFYCFFKETVNESPQEFYRVRPCKIYYYIVDDTICVNEPPVDNSGIAQGPFLKRQQIPKNDQKDIWHWTDLNIGIDVTLFGRTFHIYDCDLFTRNFLESEGIEVNESEEVPVDPYIDNRRKANLQKTYIAPSEFDKLKQFLEMDRKVLRFYCIWDDSKNMFGEIKEYIVHYYLSDDTLEVREIHHENDGRDPFPVLIKRDKVPKNRCNVPSTYPAISMELTNHEVREYLTPPDFIIGKTINIYGRVFLVYDCDNFTKAYYNRHFGITDFTPLDVKHLLPKRSGPEPTTVTKTVPENYKKADKTLQSQTAAAANQPGMNLEENCERPERAHVPGMEDVTAPTRGVDVTDTTTPVPPQFAQTDNSYLSKNDMVTLRFEAIMDSVMDENKGRRFIITYHPADQKIMVHEPPCRNSGIVTGKFLNLMKVPKPNSDPENPVYYGIHDFYIGAKIDLFEHRFIIINADLFVLKYMEAHKDQFPSSIIQSMKDNIKVSHKDFDDKVPFKRSPGDLCALVAKTITHMKSIGLTDRAEVFELFLKYDKDREGYLRAEHIQNICRKLHLPSDKDVVNEIVKMCTNDPEGRITLEQFRKFVESY